MDPLYNNNPNPAPTPTPNPGPAPISNAMPNISMAGTPAPAAPTMPQMPNFDAPAAPAMEAMPTPTMDASAPAMEAQAPTMAAPMESQAPAMPTQAPTMPTPTMEAQPAPAMSFENAFEGGATNPAAAQAAVAFGGAAMPNGISATEPITVPDPLPEPDPIEEALKAPIKAADPVPGSIGSAVSVPFGDAPAQTGAAVAPTPVNNVAFNSNPSTSFSSNPTGTGPAAKTSLLANKKLLMIIGIAAAALVMLIAIVIVILGSGNGKTNNQSQGGGQGVISPDPDPNPWEGQKSVLSCTYEYNEDELIDLGEALEGTETMIGEFNDEQLVSITRTTELVYDDEDMATEGKGLIRDIYIEQYQDLDFESDPFTSTYSLNGLVLTATHKAEDVDEIDETNMDIFLISTDKNKEIDFSQNAIEKTYKGLDYVCSVKKDYE